MKSWLSLSMFLFGIYGSLTAQRLLVVNGGIFGSNEHYANAGVWSPSNNSFEALDTVYTNSVQDAVVEGDQYAYIAAQDSIVKVDLMTNNRVAATAFGAPSTIKMTLAGNYLLVGNWYAPFGFSGTYTNFLRVFDKQTLNFVDSIPEITQPVKDIVVVGNQAFVAQNHTSTMFSDTLGFLSVIDLNTLSWLRNDTLSGNGDDLGRLTVVGDTMIYGINGVSNTISTYHVSTQTSNTIATGVDLNPKGYGATIFEDNGSWIFPFGNAIGRYDLINNSVVDTSIVMINDAYPNDFAFAVDTVQDRIFLSEIDFTNQQTNQGLVYNFSGTQVDTFQVGFSPEVLYIIYDNLTTNVKMTVSEEVHKAQVTLYPNPTTNYLTVKTAVKANALTLHDLKGQLVAAQGVDEQEPTVDVRLLPNGVYLLKLWDKEGKALATETFVKQ